MYDRDELAVPSGAALSQFREAVSEIAIDQLLDFVKSMPRQTVIRRFFDTYALIKECDSLQEARRKISSALGTASVNAVMLVSFFTTINFDSSGKETRGGSLSTERLVQLVGMETLRTLELRTPSQDGYTVTDTWQHQFDEVASLFSHWRESLEKH